MRLPDGLNLGGADFAVATDQRHAESDSRCRNDAIRKVRHFVAADKFQGISYRAVQRSQSTWGAGIIERSHQTFTGSRRNAALFH